MEEQLDLVPQDLPVDQMAPVDDSFEPSPMSQQMEELIDPYMGQPMDDSMDPYMEEPMELPMYEPMDPVMGQPMPQSATYSRYVPQLALRNGSVVTQVAEEQVEVPPPPF
jgi:hypothetical protein